MKKFLVNILAFSMLAGMAWAADIQPPGTGLRFFELPANGSNFKAFAPPASVTTNTTCTFENDANFIPDSCVGDGTDNTGLGDGNYGDVTVSGGGTIITINLNSVALGTDTTGGYAASATEAGPATTVADADFGDITIAGGVWSVDSNAVALGTDTTGNYVANLVAGNAINVGTAGEGATPTIDVQLNGIQAAEIDETDSYTWSGLSRFTGGVSETATGLDRTDIGVQAGTPRVIMENPQGSTWEIDSELDSNGGFRIFRPGELYLSITSIGDWVIDGGNNPPTFSLDDQGEMRFREEDAGGDNYVGFKAPASLTANTTCTFENDSSPIPDSCVGNGVDDTGAAITDADYGDITVSGTGSVWTIDPNSVALGTDTTGNYAAGDAEAGAALTGDSATAFFTTGSLEMARGGTGDGAAASDDQTLVSDSTSAATWRTLPDSDGATQKLQYDQTTNTFSAGTDDDVPEVGDFAALVGGTGIDNNSGTLDLDLTEVTTAVLGNGTTSSLQLGTIELGAATDTTLARSGAGDVSIEGNGIVRSGTAAGGDLTGTYPSPTVAANAVALGTDTTGNYQSGNTAGTGIAVTQTPAEGFSATIGFDYSDAGANPTLGVDECRFTSNATVAGNIVCEGDTADGIETRIAVADPLTTDKTFTIPNADSNPVQPLTCGGTDKVSAISSAGVITCTADASAAGGDNIRVEDGDNAGTFTAMSDADFDDSGDINFARAAGPPDVLTATVRADSVALGTDTTGNYVGTVADGTGIDGTCATENCTYTPVLDLTELSTATFGAGAFTALVFDAGATDPTFTFASNAVTVSNAATFSLGTSAVFTTGTIELGAATDTTIARSGSGVATLEGVEITTNSGTQTLTNKSIAATQITAGALNIGNNSATVGTVEMANGTANTLSAAAGVLSIEGNAILSAISSAGGDLTGTYPNPTVAANAVALTTDTTGNYMADIAAGAGIATTHTPAEGSTGTIALDYSDAGADPALAADTCRFTGDATTNGEIVCEGDTANTFETRFVITDPTADRVFTIPNADSVAVQPLTCGTTDKVSAVSALGVITCTADVSGSVSDGDKGDITVTGTGATWTIDNDVVTFAKMQNIATDSLIGRDTAATGDPENILLNATLSMDGSGNLQRAALTGDVTASAGSNATTVAADAVALGTDTTGVYVSQVADGTGIDGTCNAETCTYTPTLDLTEINTATFGSGTFTTLVFDAGATDPTFTMASNAVTVSNAATFSLGTTAAFTAGTIELGAASDTTLSRSGAGAVQVEGVQVVLNASSPTLGTLTTTGNVELGNASDTTLSRDAAGSLAVEGQKVKRVGGETIYIPGDAMQPTITSGCGFSNRETNGITINVPACDTTAGESVMFTVVFPKSWNAGTITYRFFWTNAAGASTQTVQFTLACGTIIDDAALNTTGLGTAVAVSDTWLAQNDMHRSAVSSAVTCSNAAADNMTYFKMTRDVANDNMAGDAELLGVELFYTSSAANDS